MNEQLFVNGFNAVTLGALNSAASTLTLDSASASLLANAGVGMDGDYVRVEMTQADAETTFERFYIVALAGNVATLARNRGSTPATWPSGSKIRSYNIIGQNRPLIVAAGKTKHISLKTGSTLTVTPRANSSGVMSTYDSDNLHVEKVDNITVSAVVAGPYGEPREIEVSCVTGTIDLTETAATGGSAPYVLPVATTSTLGGVKPDGTTVTADADGTIHASGGTAETYTTKGLVRVVTPTPAATASPAKGAAATANGILVRNMDGEAVLQFNTTAQPTVFWDIQPGETMPIFGISDVSAVGFRRKDYLTAPDTRVSQVHIVPFDTSIPYPVTRLVTATSNNATFTALANIACVGVDLWNSSNKNIVIQIGGVNTILSRFKRLRVNVTNANLISILSQDNTGNASISAQVYTSVMPGPGAPQPDYSMAYVISPSARMTISNLNNGPFDQFAHPVDAIPFSRMKFNRKSISMFQLASNVNVSSGITKADVNFNTLASGSVFEANGPRSMFNSPTINSVPQLTWNGSTAEWFTSTLNAGAPIDTTGGHIHVSLKKVSGTTTAIAVDLFSEGDPAAPGNNYHSMSLLADSGNGYEAMNSEYGKGYGVSKFTAVGTGATLTAVTFARVRITTSTSTVIIPVSIDFVKPAVPKTSVVFSIDDNHGKCIWDALSVLGPLGIPAVLYMSPAGVVIGGNNNTDGNPTVDNLLALQNKRGWQLASQDFSKEVLGDMTVEQWITEQRKMFMLGLQLGFDSEGMRDGSLYGTSGAGGEFAANSDQIKAAKRIWRSVRRFDNGVGNAGDGVPAFYHADTNPPANPMDMRSLNMDTWGGATQAQLYDKYKSYYLAAKANGGGICHFSTHTGWSTSTIRAAMQQLIVTDILPDITAGITQAVTMQTLGMQNSA